MWIHWYNTIAASDAANLRAKGRRPRMQIVFECAAGFSLICVMWRWPFFFFFGGEGVPCEAYTVAMFWFQIYIVNNHAWKHNHMLTHVQFHKHLLCVEPCYVRCLLLSFPNTLHLVTETNPGPKPQPTLDTAKPGVMALCPPYSSLRGVWRHTRTLVGLLWSPLHSQMNQIIMMVSSTCSLRYLWSPLNCRKRKYHLPSVGINLVLKYRISWHA